MENSPPPSTHACAPLSASGLLCLFGRQRDFFSGAFDLKHLPSLIVIALICGLERASASLALDALSPSSLMNSSMGSSQAGHKSGEVCCPPPSYSASSNGLLVGFGATSELSGVATQGMTAHSLGRSFSTQSFSLQRPYSLFSCCKPFSTRTLWLQQPQKITPLSCSFPSDSDY